MANFCLLTDYRSRLTWELTNTHIVRILQSMPTNDLHKPLGDPVDMSVSPPPPTPDAIRRARREAGLTQAKAASLVWRTARNWQQWESGERKMDYALWVLFTIRVDTGWLDNDY